MNNKEKTYWPEAIVLMVVAVVGLIIWTISTAVSNPVDKETKFMMDYRSVDENYNEIQKVQKEFQKEYILEYLSKSLQSSKNSIEFKITSRAGDAAKPFDVLLYLSKPFGNEKPLELGSAIFSEGLYRSNPFDVQKQGRYRVIYKIAHGGGNVFYEQDINATF